jgi:cytochrome P450
MIVEILGVPISDAAQLFHWADQIVYNADPDYVDDVSDSIDTDPYRLLPFRSPVSLQVFAHFERLAAAPDPARDLITVLPTPVDGVPLTNASRARSSCCC